jgi:hypothetical protein
MGLLFLLSFIAIRVELNFTDLFFLDYFRLSCDGKEVNAFGWVKSVNGKLLDDDVLINKYPRKTLFQLGGLMESGLFLVVAKIVRIVEYEEWWFPVCSCGRVMSVVRGSYCCAHCCLKTFDVVPKYGLCYLFFLFFARLGFDFCMIFFRARAKARVVVDDGTGIADFLLFEDVVSNMVINLSDRVLDCSRVGILVFGPLFCSMLSVLLLFL